MLIHYATRAQWIVWQRVPLPTGKVDKVPKHPELLHNIDPLDSANWLTQAVAKSWVAYLNTKAEPGREFGVGIVLYKGCGLVCVDIDDAWNGTAWSPIAKELMTQFHGAYTEVSQSGRGLHIFASCVGEVPNHKKRHTALHIEMYDEGRFIAVTGTHAAGSELFDATRVLPAVIAKYFPPGAEVIGSDGWTEAPAPEWSGPEDDDELIRRMCGSKGSAGAMLGHKAHVRDLFSANVEVLARVFPPQGEGKDYDASSADQALFNQLAYWTGGNCDRMERIGKRSNLVRDKWERESYLRGTIVKANSGCSKFYNGKDIPAVRNEPAHAIETIGPGSIPPAPPAPVGNLPPNEPPKAAPAQVRHGGIVSVEGQDILFAGCVYVQDVNQIMVPSGNTLKKEQFDNDERFRGRKFIFTTVGDLEKSAWATFTQSEVREFPMVHGTYFEPREPEGTLRLDSRGKYINTWKDPQIVATPGDVTLYTTHIKKLYPKGDDALIYTSYVAACLQNVGYKASWALLVQGAPGNGKSFLTKVLQYCLGEEYVHSAGAANLDNHFNGFLYRKLMILVEEIKTIEGNAATWEKLKTMITETRQEIEKKGIDQVTREVCFNMIFNSNHKDGIRKTKDDRRICPLFAAQQSAQDLERDGMDEDYFVTLFDWFEGGGNANVLHYLRTFEIPAKYDFTKGARRAPKTSSTAEAINMGMGSIEQDIMEAVEVGRPGFKGGWISSDALSILIDKLPRGKFLARGKRTELLLSLGYEKHPGLPDNGRPNVELPGGGRPALYVTHNHSSKLMAQPAMIVAAYLKAQK